MADYINREAMLKMIGTMPSSPITDREERLIRAFISTVKNFPAADVVERASGIIGVIPAADVREVVRGRWIGRRFSENIYGFECEVCHTTWDWDSNFCPNCGADMREES